VSSTPVFVAPEPLARLESLSLRGVRLGLTAIAELLARLRLRPARVPRVLVGGTNGKGSVAATLSAIARASGIRCGLHTSPHVERLTERIRIRERDVEMDALALALTRVFAAADAPPAIPLTYFEAVTAAAEQLFVDAGCDLAVVEVGLGGRLDATNALDPMLSIVTSIDLDHMEDLGESTARIAREKAGIFRESVPAVVRAGDPRAWAVLAGEARRRKARLVDARGPAAERIGATSDRTQSFTAASRWGPLALESPLLGRHQRENVAVAVAAAGELFRDFPAIDADSVARGVAATRWPGRLEPFDVAGRRVWLDGCHNPAGARAAADFFRERGGRPDLLFGVMKDKDVDSIADVLVPVVGRIVVCSPSSDRSASTAELARIFADRGEAPGISRTPSEGLRSLLAGPEGREIFVGGSLYLAGDIRPELLRLSDGSAPR